ncbi:iron chelate uptake ABC transporter family permease subunit [Salinibius halmophilus]|uniref:iron chelate uptake ABC transporter family permease subunit n=1 Tax=Salinibius halmophilus TaxID=1853216 RepID=UPI000E663750|nr:iron chelate uptake ABC transporter family permease subunit [Salinibius halmophilus]
MSYPINRLMLACLLAIAGAVAFLAMNRVVGWSLTWQFRSDKLLTMLVVAPCIAMSTVAFQTITFNRILTPSVMGFDALYMLLQALVVALLGSVALSDMNPYLKWAGEILLMVAMVTLLFRWLFGGKRRDLFLMILIGIIFGILFRSATDLIMRILDPVEYAAVLDASFASFNQVNKDLLLASMVICIVPMLALWRWRHRFDAMLLGRDQAINLGVDYNRQVTKTLICIAILVAVPTALVGPITFFGLLVANLAYQFSGTHKHAYVMPMAVAISVTFLVGGQAVLEHVFNYGSALAIIIEFLGGLVFILLILQRGKR